MSKKLDAKQKFHVVVDSYDTLVKTLPINELINPLFAKGVLTSTAVKEIRALSLSETKAMYLLDNFILRGLRVEIDDNFNKLVEVLEARKDDSTAQKLVEQLKEGKKKIAVASSLGKSSLVEYDAKSAVHVDAKSAKDAVRSMFGVLIDSLPIDSLIPALVAKNVVTNYNKQRMMKMTTPTDKTSFLLLSVVIPSLEATGKVTLFDNLLEAMKQSEDSTCRSLATDLSSKVGKAVKILSPKIIPPSDDAGLERYLIGSIPEGISDYNAKEQWIYAICLIQYDTYIDKKREKVSATGFVGRVTLKGEPMVVLVTNNHVFQTLEQAMNASYQFGFQSNSGRWQPEEIKGKDLIVENKQFFFSHQGEGSSLKWLDYTVVKVHERKLKDAVFTSKLDGVRHSVYDCIFDLDKYVKPSNKITGNEIVSVYHHPHSKVLQKSTQRSIECGYLLFYLCDTDEGSSGAPVVKTTNEKHRYVIGLHRGWRKLNGNSYNYGTLMSTIISHINEKIEPVYFNDEDDIERKIREANILI